MSFKEMDSLYDRAVYRACYHIYGPLAQLAFGLQVIGRENIPKQGAAIIASNHRTSLDTLALPYAVRDRHVTMLARDDLTDNKGVQWLMDRLEIVQIGRHDFSTDDLRIVDSRLRAGRIVGMYPEETRGDKELRKSDRAANLGEFKPGVAHFSRRNDVLVYPAAVSGLDNPIQKGQRRIGRVAFGEGFGPAGRGKNATGHFLDELRYRILGLYEENIAPLW